MAQTSLNLFPTKTVLPKSSKSVNSGSERKHNTSYMFSSRGPPCWWGPHGSPKSFKPPPAPRRLRFPRAPRGAFLGRLGLPEQRGLAGVRHPRHHQQPQTRQVQPQQRHSARHGLRLRFGGGSGAPARGGTVWGAGGGFVFGWASG